MIEADASYFRGKDERTQAINLEPWSSDVIYNVWAPQAGYSIGADLSAGASAQADNIGQVKCNSGSYSYYYYLKDHLGDIRMTLNSSGAVDSYNNYYPFGEQMPGTGMNLSGSSDGRYKFTSKELDPTTSLYYFGARYYSAWSGRWLSVDPLAKKYPGWGPYNYVRDNPTGFVDPNGAQQKPSWWDNIGASSSNLTLPPLTLAGNDESNPASISAHGFASPSRSSFTKSVASFVQKTAKAANTAYFWAGIVTGAGAAVATYFVQPEIAEPLADASETSFTLAFRASITSTAISAVQWLSGNKSFVDFASQAVSTMTEYGIGKFVTAAPSGTRVMGEMLKSQEAESIKGWIENLNVQPAH